MICECTKKEALIEEQLYIISSTAFLYPPKRPSHGSIYFYIFHTTFIINHVRFLTGLRGNAYSGRDGAVLFCALFLKSVLV